MLAGRTKQNLAGYTAEMPESPPSRLVSLNLRVAVRLVRRFFNRPAPSANSSPWLYD